MIRLIPLIIVSFIGVIIVIVGIILWKKQKITIIHDYHYNKIKIEDIKPYTEAMFKATIVAGMTVILVAIVMMITTTSYVVYLITILGTIVFTIMFYMAQKKYLSRSKFTRSILLCLQ